MEFLQSLAGVQPNPNLILNLITFLLGLLLNILIKMYDNKISFRGYWVSYGGRSILSGGSLITAFLSVSLTAPQVPLISYFVSGYLIDSILNKTSGKILNGQTTDKGIN